MVKIKGIIKRAVKEYHYFNLKDWSYQDAGKFWDSVHHYDEIDDETYAYKRRFIDSIKLTDIKDKSKVLDIDCRTGNGTVFFSKYGKVKEAICVSPSNNFLNICKGRIKKYKIKAKTMLLKKVPLDLKDNSFDLILCFETMEHISKKDHLKFLKEMNRLLKKNGKMIITMPNILWEPIHWFAAIFGMHHSEGPHRFLTLKKIKKLLKKSGFQIKKEKSTVIIPVGPRVLTRFGEILEKSIGQKIMPTIGLRHILICRKK